MRASWLGSTFLTVRIQCICGSREDFDRVLWQTRNYARCRRCGAVINYLNLRINHGGRMIVEGRREKGEGEEAGEDTEGEICREIAGIMRRFVSEFDRQNEAAAARGSNFPPFAPLTEAMVGEIRPLLERLADLRVCDR